MQMRLLAQSSLQKACQQICQLHRCTHRQILVLIIKIIATQYRVRFSEMTDLNQAICLMEWLSELPKRNYNLV
jgi:hypothetical protein